MAASLVALTGPLAPLQAIGTTLAQALGLLRPKIADQLAQRVKLE
jgi:hypothetical protein